MPKLIVKFLTGEEKTGDAMMFNLNKPAFHFQVETGEGKTETQSVRLDSV